MELGTYLVPERVEVGRYSQKLRVCNCTQVEVHCLVLDPVFMGSVDQARIFEEEVWREVVISSRETR